jgi:hypothetical protein
MKRVRLLALIPTVLLAACGASNTPGQSGATPTPRDCTTLAFPYPDADVTLGVADSGKTVTTHPGGLVEVDLEGTPDKHWSPIQLKGSGVRSLGTQAMTPTVGTQLGEYCGVAPGTVTLSSSHENGSWMATIKIQ